jgi:hypothetical protein
MIRTLVRMLPRRLKDRVKDSITKLVPLEKSDSFEHSLSRLSPDLKTVFDVGANVGDMTISCASGSLTLQCTRSNHTRGHSRRFARAWRLHHIATG